MSSLRGFVLSAVSTAALIAIGSAAAAADLLPTHKAPPAPVAAAPNWAGAYFGLEGGADWANTDWSTKALAVGFTPDNTSDTRFSQVGGRFGAYAGYNWVVAPTVVAGVEGDVAGDFFGTKSKAGIPGTLTNWPVGTVYSDSVSARGGQYDGSLRARLGVLATPSTLAYTTGGVAFSDPKYSINCPGATGLNSWCTVNESGSTSATRVGWTVGLGVETMLTGNWLLRAEYRYSGFPGKTTTFFPNGGLGGADTVGVRTTYDTNTINLGLAYKF